MPDHSPIGVTASNVIILETDEGSVIAHIPTTMTSADATACAQRIFDDGMAKKEDHYDAHCRDDYDIETFFQKQLEKQGFSVIDIRRFSCD